MADLLDIAPSTACEAVKLRGQRFVVRGLHGNAIASLVVRFPKLKLLLGGGEDIATLIIEQYGEVVGPIIAAGCGYLGDEKREMAASKLMLDEQFRFLKAILGLTFPNGFSALIEELTSLMSAEDEKAKGRKIRLKISPSASSPSSDKASLPIMQ